jgi:photosystem II stability/assembly factor-like uncharacterized protein
MDRLRRDLRAVFNRRQAGLGDVGDASRRVLAGGLDRRDRPPTSRTQLIAGLATIVIAALVVSTFVYIRSGGFQRNPQNVASGARTSPTPSPPATPSPETTPSVAPTPSAKPSPVRVVGDPALVIDVDVFDSGHGWALLTNCTSAGTALCAYFVSKTADGGDSWRLGVQVGPKFDPRNGDAPRHIHFASADDGFVWGGLEAYSTHDGGRTWASSTLRASEYVSFDGRRGLVWAVSYPCKKGSGLIGDCVFQVRSSADSGRTWSAAYALPATFTGVDPTAFGERGLLVASMGVAGMLLTTDGGATWQRIGARCGGTMVAELNTTSDGKHLIKDCILSVNGTTVAQDMWISSNGGRTWTRPQMVGVGPFLPECGFPIVIASMGAPGNVAMASVRCTLAITRDGGATWTEVGPEGAGFLAIAFGDSNVGWALDANHNIWVTADSGGSWATAFGVPVIPRR